MLGSLSAYFTWMGYEVSDPFSSKNSLHPDGEMRIFYIFGAVSFLLAASLFIPIYHRCKNGIGYIEVKSDHFIYPASPFNKERNIYYNKIIKVDVYTHNFRKYGVVRWKVEIVF